MTAEPVPQPIRCERRRHQKTLIYMSTVCSGQTCRQPVLMKVANQTTDRDPNNRVPLIGSGTSKLSGDRSDSLSHQSRQSDLSLVGTISQP